MFGASIRNASNQILVSSEIETLHRLGQATLESTLLSGLTNFPVYTGDDSIQTLSGRHVYRYSIVSATTPVFFIRPADYDCFHGVLQQFNVENVWYVDIIKSGAGNNPPAVFGFTVPSSVPNSTENFGMLVNMANGRTAFDSRKRPLSIYAGALVIPPTLPCDGGHPTNQSGFSWNDTTLDFNFKSNTTFNSYEMSTAVSHTNLMFAAPSIAQAVYSRQKNGYKYSSGTYSGQSHYSTAVWWVMYHSAYRLQSGAIQAGWSPYAASYWFSSTYDSGGWFDGGGGSTQTGNRPFNDKTINLSANTIIVVDARPYL